MSKSSNTGNKSPVAVSMATTMPVELMANTELASAPPSRLKGPADRPENAGAPPGSVPNPAPMIVAAAVVGSIE